MSELKNQNKFEKFKYMYVHTSNTGKLTYLIFNAVNIFASKVVGFIKLVKISQNKQHVKSNYNMVLIDYLRGMR